MPTFDQYRADYKRLWDTMQIRPERDKTVSNIAKKLLAHKDQYMAAQKATGVPWFIIAALHNRESDANFTTYLGNGEPLNRVTRLVPAGRGPFRNWQEGAIDALKIDRLDQVSEWTPERACYEIEKFNGFGYQRKGVPSPYLWSFSTHYVQGKYVSDGVFDYNAVDKQCGAMPIVKRIMELDSSARFSGRVETPVQGPVIIAAGGGTIATVAHEYGFSAQTVISILVFAACAAIAYFVIKRIRNKNRA